LTVNGRVMVKSVFFFSSRRRHTRSKRDWSSDVCSSDLKHINSLALSERLHVSHSYLKKTIKSLVKEGLVKSSPGKLGGFSLAIRSEERRVGKEGRARGGAVQGKTKMGKGQAEGGRVGNG